MKKTIALLFLFVFYFESTSFSQDKAPSARKNNSYFMMPCFAGMTSGDLFIRDHLEDSVTFTDERAVENHRIKSFHLTITCNGVPLKYFENNAGNHLTAEMKEAVVKFHPGCMIVIDAIRSEAISKEFKGEMDMKHTTALRFQLK